MRSRREFLKNVAVSTTGMAVGLNARGKVVPVPADLDWDLWQGPAPRQPYKDNVHPYNWH
jgi:Oxidoreductase family, C-terminal alpha/beta domain